jgi:hypothetical protein
LPLEGHGANGGMAAFAALTLLIVVSACPGRVPDRVLRKETGQLENTAKLRLLRRDIARAETILREKRGADE